MRVPSAVRCSLVLAAAATLLACGGPAPLGSTAVNVEISATCSDNEVRVAVRPWQAGIPLNSPIEWSLSPGSDVSAFEILNRTERGRRWPFENAPPYRSENGRAGSRGRMVGKVGEQYRYAIEMTCIEEETPDQPRREHRVVIDPDIIIDRALQ